jgi:hypothetical protein
MCLCSPQGRLEFAVEDFTLSLVHCNARWVNMRKLHYLRHLGENIRRFGPALNFATEKFESFHGILRQQATHSNRQAPSRDIAEAFANRACLRFLCSGGYWLDHGQGEHGKWVRAGDGVREDFGRPNSFTRQRLGFRIKEKPAVGECEFISQLTSAFKFNS